jgi:hypothetical protein
MATMLTWSERRFYSIKHDCEAARISGFDDHHQEHWMVIERGKGYADRRKDTVRIIMESIEAGDLPGEVPD